MHHCKHGGKAKCWKFIPLVIIGIAVLGYVLMALWNWILPDVIDTVHTITYLQALGLLVLSRILFGGLRGHGCRGRWHHHRWHHMSEEERAKFRASGCGCGGGKCEETTEAAADAKQE